MNINNLNKSKIEFSDIENVFSLDFFSMSKESNSVSNTQAASIRLLKDTELLIATAAKHNLQLCLMAYVGDFVQQGQVLLKVFNRSACGNDLRELILTSFNLSL